MTDPRQEDRERMASEPIRAQHSDEVCPGCLKRILAGEAIDQHRGEWVHAEGSCSDLLDELIAEADRGSAAG